MSFDENAALDVTAVRAIESADRAGALWTEADRAWASRAAAEVVGERGGPEAFLAARARLALTRLGERFKALPRAVGTLRWRPWVGTAVVAAAFVAGVAIDQVGGTQRINLLAPPLFALLAWNLAVYALLAVGFVVRYGDAARSRPLREAVMRIAGGRARSGRGEWSEAIEEFAGDWARLSAPVYTTRAARILHLAAAVFAVGLVTGLYVRGIAFEYRASWESTFLGAPTIRSLLAAVLAPGSAVTGIAVPSVAEVEAIHMPGSENAARWLHLIAATIAVLVIVPRLALALSAWGLERHRATHLPLTLEAPYFARLLRGYRGGPIHVHVVPYSYTMPPAAATGVERLLRGVFGSNAALTIGAPVGYGDEETVIARAGRESTAHIIALFSATATPEPEAHGAFLAALASGGAVVALIDEAAMRERFAQDPARLEGRRAAWRALCEDQRVRCVFVDLAAPDSMAAQSELERTLADDTA